MAEVQATTELKSPEPDAGVHHDSEEYASAEEVYEEDEEEIEEVEVEEEEEDDEEHQTPEVGERELDDDEDRKNPQFIPKKGYFYEHDDRTQADEEEGEEPKEEVAKEQQVKKVTKQGGDRWSHDLYDEGEQAHKSKEEIIATYGYDIRAEEQPPKAMRRRRYGRGPKKYTRKSDDVEAYQKPRGGYGGRGGRRGSNSYPRRNNEVYDDEFPALHKNAEKFDAQNDGPSDGSMNRGGHMRGGRGGGPGRPPRTNRAFDNERDGNQGYRDNRNQNFGDFSNRERRGGGRGRRNEFTNRNRYNRDRPETNSSVNEYGGNFNRGPPGGKYEQNQDRGDVRNERPERLDRPERPERLDRPERPERLDRTERPERPRIDNEDRRKIANGTPSSENKGRHDTSSSKSSKPAITAPFTNTEYTGSASLTANKSPPSNAAASASHANKSDSHRNSNGTELDQKKFAEPRTDPRDHRDINRRPPTKNFQGERRPQVPPRLQQQQLDQTAVSSGKSKRFSNQRQRQVDTAIQPSALPPSSMIPQVVPVSTPVVTGSGPMVPSPVPNFTPQQPYYDAAPGNFDAQVYDSAGSPMAGNGPSVSPSLWGPHPAAYATSSYPSPPTGTQVQVQPPPYADATAYIAAGQPPGPAIYAAPPQYIQDPTMLNFAPPPGPQFAPPYHPQGFQGYAQVTPAPPPEVYHGGVTYYNTHNQIQRPPIMTVQKRPKTVLQLVEPPEKLKTKDSPPMTAGSATVDDSSGQDDSSAPYEDYDNVEQDSLVSEASTVIIDDTLAPPSNNIKPPSERTSPCELSIIHESTKQPESWASQMDQMSPTEKVPSVQAITQGLEEVHVSCDEQPISGDEDKNISHSENIDLQPSNESREPEVAIKETTADCTQSDLKPAEVQAPIDPPTENGGRITPQPVRTDPAAEVSDIKE